MIGSPVSIISGNSVGDDIQWGAGQDSFYEVCPLYLPRLTLGLWFSGWDVDFLVFT
jgi:hypothetical protein